MDRTRRILPEAITQLSEEDKIRYNKLMQSSKSEKRYFVRTMIVGKESVGKTCLMRRLLKEDISDVTSTDGVNIVVRRCKINVKNGEWIIGKDIYDDRVSRIKRALIPNAEDKESQGDTMSTYKRNIKTDGNVSRDKSEETNESSSFVIPNIYPTESKVTVENDVEKNGSSPLVIPEIFTTDTKVNLDNYNKKNETSSLEIPKDLISNVFSKSIDNTLSNLYALCEIWDFAGQKEFYATHQAFLTSCAIYLVVADMTDGITEQGLSHCFADFQNIGGSELEVNDE